MKSEITKEVTKQICAFMNVSEAEVIPNSDLKDDLFMDSLDRVEVVLGLESALSISIPNDKIEQVETVNDMVELVMQCMQT